jgi:hypothetical protein
MLSLDMVNGTADASMQTFAGNTNLSGVTTYTNSLASGIASYRVVSWGFRLLMADNYATAKGNYTVAPFPLGTNAIIDPVLLTNSVVNAACRVGDHWGAPRPTGSLEVMPMSEAFSAQDLQNQGDFMFHGIPYSTDCTRFRSMATSNNTPYQTGTDLFSFAAGNIFVASGALPATANHVGSKDILDMTGNIGCAVYANGLPFTANEVTLELRYHVEFVPATLTGLVGMFGAAKPPVGSTATIEKVLRGAQQLFSLGKEPLFRTAMTNVGMAGLTSMSTRHSARLR